MTAAITSAATALTAAGLVCLIAATGLARAWRQGLQMALDLWVAAGLLRLSADPSPWDVLAAAAIIAVRQFVAMSMRVGEK